MLEILPLCQGQASAVLCCVRPLCSVTASLTVRCSNTTGPLAEEEAGGQRAAAQSVPEVLNSVAVRDEKILDRRYKAKS